MPDPAWFDNPRLAGDVRIGEFASRDKNCDIEYADVEVVWEAIDDDAMVRAERESHEAVESRVSSQDGRGVGY